MPKTILTVISTLRRTGPVNVVLGVVRLLDRAKYRSVAVTLSQEKSDSMTDEFRELNVPVVQLNLPRFAVLEAPAAIRKAAKFVSADIVHCHCVRSQFFTSRASLRMPTVATIHSDLPVDYSLAYGKPLGYPLAAANFIALRSFTKVVCVSEPVRRRAGTFLLRSDTIENGISLSQYRPPADEQEIRDLRARFGWPLDKVVVVHASVLSRRKRAVDVVRGFLGSQMSQGAILALAGSGPMEAQCRSIASGAPNVLFLGFRHDTNELMRAADVLISASVSEGFALAVSEACATGLRLLLSDIPYHRRVCDLFPKQVRLMGGHDFPSISVALDKCAAELTHQRPVLPPESLYAISDARMAADYQSLYDQL
ncbi:MAG: glycosyltransferase family 4 protein [Candidatus Acidiferrales bacterium]